MAAKLVKRYLCVEDKVFLVTGGAAGVGAGIVRALLAENARVGYEMKSENIWCKRSLIFFQFIDEMKCFCFTSVPLKDAFFRSKYKAIFLIVRCHLFHQILGV